jgi:hypothetical protein
MTGHSSLEASSRPMELHDTTLGFLPNCGPTSMHPPSSYFRNEYKYRTADGAYNVPNIQTSKKASTAYARTVNPLTIQHLVLPDPSCIFDSVMARTNVNSK